MAAAAVAIDCDDDTEPGSMMAANAAFAAIFQHPEPSAGGQRHVDDLMTLLNERGHEGYAGFE